MTAIIEEEDYPKINSEAISLLLFMKYYSFIVALIVWYDVLYQINIMNKKLQSMETSMSELIDLMEGCTYFFHQYRTDGFENVKQKLQNKFLNNMKLILFLFSIDQDGRKHFSVMKVQLHPVVISMKYSQGMSSFLLLI
jgi:hypothetical protein